MHIRKLKRIITFCEKFKESPFVVKPGCITSTEKRDLLPGWFCDFVDTVPEEDMNDLLMASNFMLMDTLKNALCQVYAAYIRKNWTPDQIIDGCGMRNPIDPKCIGHPELCRNRTDKPVDTTGTDESMTDD